MSKFQDPALRWAHSHDPYSEVKVLEHGFGEAPVLSIDRERIVSHHRRTGVHVGDPAWDLVPLQEPLLECWVNEYENGVHVGFYSAEQAENNTSPEAIRVAVKMREVRDE